MDSSWLWVWSCIFRWWLVCMMGSCLPDTVWCLAKPIITNSSQLQSHFDSSLAKISLQDKKCIKSRGNPTHNPTKVIRNGFMMVNLYSVAAKNPLQPQIFWWRFWILHFSYYISEYYIPRGANCICSIWNWSSGIYSTRFMEIYLWNIQRSRFFVFFFLLQILYCCILEAYFFFFGREEVDFQVSGAMSYWGWGGGSEGHEPFLPFFARGIMSDLAKALAFKGSKIIEEGSNRW